MMIEGTESQDLVSRCPSIVFQAVASTKNRVALAGGESLSVLGLSDNKRARVRLHFRSWGITISSQRMTRL